MADDTLTPRQARFVDEYLIDLNAKEAAIRAGYSEHSAKEIGYELTTLQHVAAAIEAAKAARTKRVQISTDWVLDELRKLAGANMQDYMTAQSGGDPFLDFSKLTREQAAALQEVTVEDYTEGRGENARDVKRVRFKLADKRAALTDIGKHLGMFVERKAVTFPQGVPVMQLTKDEFKELAQGLVGGV